MSYTQMDINATDLAAALERIGDGLLALDASWHITFVNATAAAVFGRSRESLLGRHVWEEFPEGIGTEFHLAYERALRTQEPHHFEGFSPPHGRWFETSVYPASSGLSIVFRDVSERHDAARRLTESEQRYRSLFVQNVDAVMTLDPDGCFQEVNAACEQLTGRTAAALRGTSFLPLVAPEDRDGAHALTSFIYYRSI